MQSSANSVGEDVPYLSVFRSDVAKSLVERFVRRVASSETTTQESESISEGALQEAIQTGSSALNAFLQANVTGPVLQAAECQTLFITAYNQTTPQGTATTSKNPIEALRKVCLKSLDIDGVSVYAYIPHIELFCFAKWVLTSGEAVPLSSDLAWTRFRIHLWHYKLLSQPSLGPGSLFTKTGRFTDVATLQELVEKSLEDAETTVLASTEGGDDIKAQFLLEKSNAHVMLGNDTKAKDALQLAAQKSGFTYALSGALGKRTKWQEKSTSQLVVLAKSAEDNAANGETCSGATAPQALALNDDTLLEKISFKDRIAPNNQPQLKPEDKIILLTEAMLKDTFSPSDSLTAEEILPFAERVINDKSTNWQIYTQALLVRSRIELNRSRTLERGVLQMQAVVDQVITDTDASTAPPTNEDFHRDAAVPSIEVSQPGEQAHAQTYQNKPTSFLPAPKDTESAPAHERLRYVNALSSPPRWHLESELGYAWASVGSLISALEIFKRLRMWPEVALCLGSSESHDDGSGRGDGGVEKARALVRWRLYHRTGETKASAQSEDTEDAVNTDDLKLKDYYGGERDPPPNAPRLFCILGDLEEEPAHYQRAWEISKPQVRESPEVFGLSPELWSRLGDIELRLAHFPDAAEAYQRAIYTSNGEEGGEDARTWSNLGGALLSWYREVVAESKILKSEKKPTDDDEEPSEAQVEDLEKRFPSTSRAADLNKSARNLLLDSLSAFKRGATTAHSNWRIWDNVVTLAASLKPEPALDDVVLGTRNVLSIRKTEDALDHSILSLLVREVSKEPAGGEGDSIYVAPRGTIQTKIISLFEDDVVPLITTDSEAWSLISRLRAWRRDYAGALDAAEKGWRAATAGAGSGSALSASTGADGAKPKGDWLNDADAWDTVVSRTEELVAAYENWGSRLEAIGDRWRGKARSAVRSVMSKGRENWEGSAGWKTLEDTMEGLKI
ncbi:TPR repeat-containing protein C19B12.01 [Apiospora phragmitis]|uniref:TPR repeat-containing protein C19B12.01 n=1 Tax=Apiospora phragmitis TaxID=2905665 RepID=A0ABR1TAY2_9PEZI